MKSTEKKYVTKRLVARLSKSAFKSASSEAMEANGYVVVVKDGWVVKEFSDGRIEAMEKLDADLAKLKPVLD